MSVSYTKTVWVNGEAPYINDDNLNHIEQGIADVASQANANETAIASLADDVDTRIDGVDATLATKEAKDTNGTYTALTGGIYYVKKHGWVNITAYNTGTTLASGSWKLIATIPAGYRPSATVYSGTTIGNSGNIPAYVRVQADGGIYMYSATAISSALIIFNITYAVAE